MPPLQSGNNTPHRRHQQVAKRNRQFLQLGFQDRHLPFQIYFWIPEDTLDLRVRRDHVTYDVWERQGFLETTERNVVHYGYIEKFIERLGERFNIREIAFDRLGAVQMIQNLEGMGFTVVPFGQGFKDMSPPTKELMKLTLEQKLAHGGHQVLRWMMDNIYIRTDPAGKIKADKEKSTEKIDGAVATTSWALTVRSAVETISVLLSTMKEEFCSYKNGALVFTQKLHYCLFI